MARCLIIDDGGAVRGFIRQYLELAGHVVREVTDSASALVVLQASVVDVLILDLGLSQATPIDFIRTVKQLMPSIKIIATSAMPRKPWDKVAENVLTVGADVVIHKPCKIDYLSAVVRFVTDRARRATSELDEDDTSVRR